MTYFERALQEFWQQIIKQNIAQNTSFTEQPCLDHNYHWLLASKLLCIWFLILHARIQSLKESQEVPEELFSSELIETIVGVTYKKTTAAKDNFR